ncbi:MAG: Methionine import ATP-binding protein MetN 2 [Alphaproteobacteria bacterium ADurb.BinA305]|nr:MAG: Methionine import ATP-binding protein MetN 2 [Alphaproteobacteria bacterium ADurb.BinA305]
MLGRVPWLQRVEHVRHIGVVFGQRTQLWWDLPVIESFELLRHMYRVPEKRYRENLDTFNDLLGLSSFFGTPVRQLSLGQRMRADIAAALLHDPDVLFLDEPTIGLDVVAKEKVREFVRAINRERQVTILLTTHDLGDVEKLCERVIIIDHARVVFDGRLEEIRRRFDSQRLLVVDFAEPYRDVSVPGAELLESDGRRAAYRLGRDAVARVTADILTRFHVEDLAIRETEIEEIVRRLYVG